MSLKIRLIHSSQERGHATPWGPHEEVLKLVRKQNEGEELWVRAFVVILVRKNG